MQTHGELGEKDRRYNLGQRKLGSGLELGGTQREVRGACTIPRKGLNLCW